MLIYLYAQNFINDCDAANLGLNALFDNVSPSHENLRGTLINFKIVFIMDNFYFTINVRSCRNF